MLHTLLRLLILYWLFQLAFRGIFLLMRVYRRRPQGFGKESAGGRDSQQQSSKRKDKKVIDAEFKEI